MRIVRYAFLWAQLTGLLFVLPPLVIHPPAPTAPWWWQIAGAALTLTTVATLAWCLTPEPSTPTPVAARTPEPMPPRTEAHVTLHREAPVRADVTAVQDATTELRAAIAQLRSMEERQQTRTAERDITTTQHAAVLVPQLRPHTGAVTYGDPYAPTDDPTPRARRAAH